MKTSTKLRQSITLWIHFGKTKQKIEIVSWTIEGTVNVEKFPKDKEA